AHFASAAAPGDSLPVKPPVVRPPVFRESRFDSVPHPSYLIRHSYTLDNFLEFEPGYFLGRYGPIGRSIVLSRYGFGRGRCSVYLNNTLINDPQNGVAPLPHFPVSGLGVLLGSGTMEGRIRAVEVVPAPDQPTTFLELSKSTQRNLRQRRVWFSSMRGKIGLDFGYDEILNDGYSFDASQLYSPNYVFGPDYGESHSRYITLNLRGELPTGDRYKFSVRRFQADSNGDLVSSASEQAYGGYLASVEANLGRVDLNIYSRGFDATTWPQTDQPPDSNTVNLAAAAFVDVHLVRAERRRVSLGGGYENIDWIQNVGEASGDGTLRKWTARISAVSHIGGDVVARVRLSGVTHVGMRSGWGGSFAVDRPFGGHTLSLDLRRGYRMPNLGELFLPPHPGATAPGLTIAGNRYLDSEYGWEAGGRLTSRFGPVTNELRGFALWVNRPIAFDYATVDGSTWLVAENGGDVAASVIEDRLRVDARLKGFTLLFAGSGSYTGADRESYFLAAPRWNAHASFRFGRSIFQKTSALYVGLDYTYRSKRNTVGGGELPSYQVLNVKLDGRLLNANLYLMLMNVFNEKYQTVDGYLMTPRTLVYGLSWKIFN
ncbi:MAG: TonB-dependent receptor, partial [Candidatus Latescibacterota bacterium]